MDFYQPVVFYFPICAKYPRICNIIFLLFICLMYKQTTYDSLQRTENWNSLSLVHEFYFNSLFSWSAWWVTHFFGLLRVTLLHVIVSFQNHEFELLFDLLRFWIEDLNQSFNDNNLWLVNWFLQYSFEYFFKITFSMEAVAFIRTFYSFVCG